ncbi:MAG: phosphate starvation-inducible protein PhoH, partial [Pseudomonadota bacterium]
MSPAPPSAADLHEKVVTFPDNFLLIDLCGEYDRNLAEIEQALGVQILRRGNELAIIGDADAMEHASQILSALYHRLEQGRSLDRG